MRSTLSSEDPSSITSSSGNLSPITEIDGKPATARDVCLTLAGSISTYLNAESEVSEEGADYSGDFNLVLNVIRTNNPIASGTHCAAQGNNTVLDLAVQMAVYLGKYGSGPFRGVLAAPGKGISNPTIWLTVGHISHTKFGDVLANREITMRRIAEMIDAKLPMMGVKLRPTAQAQSQPESGGSPAAQTDPDPQAPAKEDRPSSRRKKP
jgi:hypothetical protein